MTSPERRQTLYSKMLRFMIKNKVEFIPADIPTVCSASGIDLTPLSEILSNTGLCAEEVFSFWGNEDGAVHLHDGKHKIAYNDSLSPRRIRFTLCEELAHVIYGHTQDQDFNMFTQGYAPEKYAQYDEEARLGAGFLICHPRFFYTYEHCLNPQRLSSLCEISLPCAKARCEIFAKYKGEIVSNVTYQFSRIPRTKANIRKVVGY